MNTGIYWQLNVNQSKKIQQIADFEKIIKFMNTVFIIFWIDITKVTAAGTYGCCCHHWVQLYHCTGIIAADTVSFPHETDRE